MISKEEYDTAKAQRNAAEAIMQRYHREQIAAFDERLRTNPIFTDDELRYSATTLCPCGHGLAYPKGCGPFHYWDCSAILKGIAEQSVKHTGQLPFAFYDIKSEDDGTGSTTRGVFRPKPSSPE